MAILRSLLLTLTLLAQLLVAQHATPVYLIPGQGSDQRIFDRLALDPAFDTTHIRYCIPDSGWTMHDFARHLATQIDTSTAYILIGVSLGGMLAAEMNDFLHPQQTILISSAKCAGELPARYTFQQKVPVYALIPPETTKKGAQIMQPIVEPNRNKEKETFEQMLAAKDPVFLQRTIHMIINWDRSDCSDKLIHIHGDNDHTLPLRQVQADYVIEGGSHMMTLTRGDEISSLLNQLLKK